MSFWSKTSSVPSNTLNVYQKVGGSIFIESDDLVSEEQIREITAAIWQYEDCRFVKIDMPTTQKEFGSVDDAIKYLNRI